MATWETVLIDGVDISLAGVRIIEVWDGAHEVPGERGGPVPYPGRDGATDTDGAFDPYPLRLGLRLEGSSLLTGFNDVHRALKQLCKVGRVVTLTRRLSYSTGQESHTALGRYLSGLGPTLPTPAKGKLMLAFNVLDGVWHGPSATLGTGAITALGDVRTHRMTITLSGGTNPQLTNSGTGHSMTYTGSTSTPVVVDVEAMTATQGGADVSANLSWSRAMPFRLNPGSQNVSVSSGSASISYQPAYL